MISSRDGIGRLGGRARCENKIGTKGGEQPDDGNAPVLSTDLSRCSCLCAYLCSERTHFFDDQLLHAADRVFLFKREVEFLRHNRSGGKTVKVGKE